MDWGRNTGLICVGRPEQYFGACWPHFYFELHFTVTYFYSISFTSFGATMRAGVLS